MPADLPSLVSPQRRSPPNPPRPALQTLSNSTLVLSEALASIQDSEPLAVREPFVAELADTCVRMRSRLERYLGSLTDEVGIWHMCLGR